MYVSGWYMEGSNITTLHSGTPEKCLDICKEYPSCDYGVYNLEERKCTLKKGTTSLLRKLGSILVASSYKQFTRLPGVEIWGDVDSNGHVYGYIDDIQHPTGVEEVCRKLCAVHPQCNTAGFWGSGHSNERLRNICILKRIFKKSHTTGAIDANVVTFSS